MTMLKLDKLPISLDSHHKLFVCTLIKAYLKDIKLQVELECLITQVYKRTLIVFVMHKKKMLNKNVSSMLESVQKNNKMIWNDNSSTLDLSIQLCQILIQVSTLRKRTLKPFWTSAYNELSKKLWLPTKIDYVDLPMTCSSMLSIRQVERVDDCQASRNLLPSRIVDKWESENIEKDIVKCRKIRLKVTDSNRSALDEWFNTSRYVYNKTVCEIKNGAKVNFQDLRNKLVTKERDKIRNKRVKDWETRTPKEVRATAVKDVCNAYKTSMANLKAKNIKHFDLSYKKKTSFDQSIGIQKQSIKNKNGNLEIYSRILKPIKLGKRSKNLKVGNCDARLVKQKNRYFICVPMKCKTEKNKDYKRVVGIDPGVRKFMTIYSEEKISEYRQKRDLLKRLNAKIDKLRMERIRPLRRGERVKARKKSINKVEIRKSDLIDELHWKTIREITKENDVVCYGDIKSHDIVKRYNNNNLNREIMDLKLYKFKERLRNKCIEYNKVLIEVDESYTSKTCTNCGVINDVKDSERYECKSCEIKIDRDLNGARNIMLKGIQSLPSAFLGGEKNK